MKNKEAKNILIMIGIATIIILAMFLPYIIRQIPLVYGTDLKPQWFFFYTEFENLINSLFADHSLPFYSWKVFLGSNFWASKSYYLTGDIFAYLGLLFKGYNFFDINMILEVIKLYIACLTMYYLLTKYQYNGKTKIIGSLCYAFSGWAIFFSGQMVFLSFYCLMPLYFATIENYLQNNKKVLFIISAALLLFTNYYLFFTISLLTVIYFIYRYYILNKSLKKMWPSAFKLIGYYFVGAMITGVLTLPTVYFLLGSDRFNQSELHLFQTIQVYFHELVSALIPNYLYIYRQNVFETGWHVNRELCLYGGAIIALLVPQFITSKDHIFKKATSILYLILVLMMVFPVGGFVLHGFSDASFRWLLFFIMINITVGCRYLNDQSIINKNTLRISLITIACLLMIIVPVTAACTGQLNAMLKGDFNYQLLSCFVFAVIYVVLYLVLTKSGKVLISILVITALELGGSAFTILFTSMDLNQTGSYQFIDDVTHVLQDNDNDLNNYLDSIEPVNTSQYYRVYVPHESLYWDYSHNMSVMYQLNGLMTYDSSYAPSFNQMKKLVNDVNEYESEWIFNIKDDNLDDFLSVKYAIVTKEEELPTNGNYRLITDNYRGLLIYRNDDYRPLGTTYSQIIKESEYSDDTSQFLTTIIANEKDYDEIKNLVGSDGAELENISYYHNQLTGYCYSDKDSFMVLGLPYDAGWNVRVNGQSVKTYQVNGGFIGFEVTQGDNSIEMYFTPKGFKQGAIGSAIGIIGLVIIAILEIRRNKSH